MVRKPETYAERFPDWTSNANGARGGLMAGLKGLGHEDRRCTTRKLEHNTSYHFGGTHVEYVD